MMDDSIKINHGSLSDLDQYVDFAFRINRQIERSSSFCSKSEPSIRKDLLGSIKNNNLTGAWKSDQIIGMISTYVDASKNNVDCFILIDSDLCKYDEIAKVLLDSMRAQMKSQFHYTFFFSNENIECSTFLKSLNAFQKPNEYGLLVHKMNSDQVKKSEKVQILPKAYHERFIELHDTIFPDVYISGKEIISDIEKNHYVFAFIEKGLIKAYSVLFLKGNPRATAEIIAVHQDFRHQGYGRTILSHLIYSAFNDFGLEAVDLIVDSDNANALQLYLKMGFIIEFENQCYVLS